MRKRLSYLLLTSILVHSCTTPGGTANFQSGSFGYDLRFLQQHDSGLVVLQSGDAKIVVSPKYQGKVFTSTALGDAGPSFGWIHYKAFDGPSDPHMNAYGGENRLWLGPEGGKFSLFFPPSAKMEFTNWKTPAAFDTKPWTVTLHSDTVVDLRKDMQLTNYAGTMLSLSIDRSIAILNQAVIDSILGLAADTAVHVVGYRTFNILTNTGAQPWTESTGMPCLWLLDMFNPSPATVIVIPYASATGDISKPATTDYFGEIPADRVKYDGQTLFFKADGKSRGKLGMHPKRAKPMIGSYDAQHHVLTITLFDVDSSARYLNQEWNMTKPSFSGDAVNAYNDGPLAKGSQMGPFYELESVSPAAFLSVGQSQVHRHSVFHFTGLETALAPICRKLLGVSIGEVKQAF
jgi:hypothetical protein